MKKIILILCVSAFAVSCGQKKNTVSSATTISGSEGLEVSAMFSNFTGEYDILRKDSQDCSNAIRIVSECNGLKILSNGFNAAEEFCNINRGIQRLSHEGDNRNPPNPDRNPPNPDRGNPANGETRNVTLNGNVLSSELRISDRIAFTNSLTMNDNGVLVKVSNLKSRTSRCIYQKRI